MELSKTDDKIGKLILILKKMTECKKFDRIYTEKFLDAIIQEFPNISENIIHEPTVSKWLSETFDNWKQVNPNVAEAIFICKFIEILTKNEKGLQFLLEGNILIELTNFLQSQVFEQTAIGPVYISFLSDIMAHTIGYEWIKSTKQWVTVKKLYFSNTNLYIEREGLKFLIAFISKVVCDGEESKNIFREIFLLLSTYNEINYKDQKFCTNIHLYLKLIQSLLKVQVFYKNSLLLYKLLEVFDLQLFLNYLLENSNQEIILEEASLIQVTYFVLQNENKNDLKDLSTAINSFMKLIKKNQFNGVIKLAKYCQVLWSEMRKKMKCESETGIDYILVQLLPALMCSKSNTSFYEVYIQELFLLSSTGAQTFYDLLSNEIGIKISMKPKNLALKGILSVISNSECLNSEESVVIFQAMINVLNSFISESNGPSKLVNFYVSEKGTLLSIEDTALLSAVLNVLCVLIEKFKIRWPEILKNFCLFKVTSSILENPNLPPVVTVQVFSLVKLAVLNFINSSPSLSSNINDNSNFSGRMSLLVKHLYDPHWEVRDSCLEVITTIFELSESEYSPFKQLLVEKNLCSLVLDIMEGDSESYVRASAIQALIAMMKVEALKQFLISRNISQKIVHLLQNESEAIVRREAALMIKQLYLALIDVEDEITIFYEVMSYSAVCDLHWEVKINSLIFWEAVIRHISADQGIINKYIPFSKEEVKSRLNKILKKLSEIGCLYVLLSTLNDDCDMPVIQKSAQILSELMGVLECYGVEEFSNNNPVCGRIPTKRKNTVLDPYEEKESVNLLTKCNCDGFNDINLTSLNNKSACSDIIIDEIVNEMDINLLGVCLKKNQTINVQNKILHEEVKPETFLSQMKNFNFEKFLENKQKWVVNTEVDFKSLLLETSTLDATGETNVMDCY